MTLNDVQEDPLGLHPSKKEAPSYQEQKPLVSKEEEEHSVSIQWKIFLYALFVLALICMCTSVAAVQFLQGAMPVFQSNVLRFGALTLIPVPVLILKHRCNVLVPPERLPVLFAAILSVAIFNFSYYPAATFIPAGEASAMNTAFALICSSMLSICIKSERKLHLYISTILAVTGTILLSQPSFMFGTAELPGQDNSTNGTSWTSRCLPDSTIRSKAQENPGLSYGLLVISASSLVASFHFLHKAVKNISPFVVCFHLGLTNMGLSFVLSATTESLYIPSGTKCDALVIAGTFGVAIYLQILFYCLTCIEPPVMVLLKSFDQVILLTFQFTFLYKIQPGNPNGLAIVGAMISLVGTWLGPTWQLYQDRLKVLE